MTSIRNPHLSKDQIKILLLEGISDTAADAFTATGFTNVVRMTIMTLRRKLGDPPIVETVIGVGYRLAKL